MRLQKVGRWRKAKVFCDPLLGIHHDIVVAVVLLGSLEVVVILILIVVDHLVLLYSLEVDLGSAGAATLDDVGRVDLGKVVLLDVYLMDCMLEIECLRSCLWRRN